VYLRYAFVISTIIDDEFFNLCTIFLIIFVIILLINLQLRWGVRAVDVRKHRPLKLIILIL
jgi:hypothetical protein